MRTITAALTSGILLICLALPSLAATVSGLYEAQVPVQGEDTASRNQAIGEALGQVLVKITGRDPAPGAADLAPQAARYVQQFRYRRELAAEGGPQTALWVRFDKAGLDRVLRDKGLPLWGSSRPGVLVWLATERAGRRELIGAEGELAAVLNAAAAARGLPVQLPLLDLEDQARLTSADLWSDYAPAVQQASERYGQPLVLTGRLRQVAPGHWDSRWTLYEGEASELIEAAAADAAGVIRAVIGQVAERLAARYAPAGGQDGPESLRVKIVGVTGLSDYVRALQLIGERDVVDRVAVRGVDGDSLELDVLARGGRDALAQVLDLVRGLHREPDPLPPPEPPPVFESLPPLAPLPPATATPGAPVVEPRPAATLPTVPGEPAGPEAVLSQPEVMPGAPPEPPKPARPVDLVYRLMP